MYKSIDLFAGIGGIRLGFEQAFAEDIKTVFVSEGDKSAQITYKANFEDGLSIAEDITKISETEIPKFDICLAGFPPQAFSLAGKRMEFNDDYKGHCRGTLFQDVVRICEYHKPKVVFFESVKGLTIHDKGRTFKDIKRSFEHIGYNVYSKVLNSKDFGVPQNRERLYLVCFRKDIDSSSFSFPTGTDDSKRIRDILEEAPISSKYYLSDVYVEALRKHRARHEAAGNGFGYEIRSLDGIACTIVSGGMGQERNLIIDERPHSLKPTTHIKGEINKESIRKMTPREWARLQGFPDSYQLVLADNHLYKQFGNSVTVTVIEAIAMRIKEVLSMSDTGSKNVFEEDVRDLEGIRVEMPETRDRQKQLSEEKNKAIKKEYEDFDPDEDGSAGNIGDWSEIYVLYRVMEQGQINTADEEMNILYHAFLPVLKVIREERKVSMQYCTSNPENKDNALKIFCEGSTEPLVSCTVYEFKKMADDLFGKLVAAKKDKKTSTSSMKFRDHAEFLNHIFIRKIKAPSAEISKSFGGKSDITMEIIQQDNMHVPAGFSIKSGLGSPSALVNSSGSNDIYYKLNGCTDAVMTEFNSINTRSWVVDRIKYLLDREDIKVEYFDAGNAIFKNNLELISSDLPEIVAYALLYSCGKPVNGTGSNRKMKNVLASLVKENPLARNENTELYYHKRIKDFLFEFACGMQTATPWDGNTQIKGGYIFVKKSGDILVYYASDQDNFKNWLVNNTKFDMPSTSRHQTEDGPCCGYIHKDKGTGEYFLTLSLLVKFIK